LAPVSTSRPAIPDRQTFQRSLSEYNDQIAVFTNEPGKLKALREQKAPLRAKREELKRKADARKPEIAELRRQLDSKVNLIAVISVAVLFSWKVGGEGEIGNYDSGSEFFKFV
uniref:Triple QxxK/R motif-containing protein n=1 Tax=Parascaris equorum TaxID=6256 RepID=A0A914R8C2_PAREQ